MKIARRVLAVLGVLFLLQGSVQLFQPELLTNIIGLDANSITAKIELQVMYGGLHLAFGAICLWGVVRPSFTMAALTAMLFVAVGVALPRVGLGFLYRDFSAYSIAAMSMEVAAVLVIGLVLRHCRQDAP